MRIKPTHKEWRQLYEAAIAYRDLAPWQWLRNEDLICAVNPEDGTRGYCCVLGDGRESYGLTVFRGAAGLHGFNEIRKRGDEFEPELALRQDLLTVSFEDRKYARPEDAAVISSLHLKIRGKGQYPIFRDHTPGLYPWFLTASQARFMYHALACVVRVAERAKTEKNLLRGPEGKIFTQISAVRKNGVEWSDAWETPEPYKAPAPGAIEVADDIADLIHALPVLKDQTWEVDLAHALTPVQQRPNTRPFFPLMLLGVEQKRGIIIGSNLIPADMPLTEMFNVLLAWMEDAGGVPEKILTCRPEAFALVQPACLNTGTTRILQAELPAVREVKKEMEKFLNQR